MEYTDVKEWLNTLAERFKLASEIVYLSPRISGTACTMSKVFISDCIDVVADIMGLELHEEQWEFDGEKWYEYWFLYDGVKFANCTRGRLESFVSRDREQNGG